MKSFAEKQMNIWQVNRSKVCVGLDPDLKKLPECVKKYKHPVFEFNRALVEATGDLVCSYKPQFAYYAAYGLEDELKMTIDFIREKFPDVPVILDAKRGDIGATAQMYALEAFERYEADALTVNPYMGGDTLKPYLERTDKGVVVLCRTSNPGSSEFQSLVMENGRKLYEEVALRAEKEWNKAGNVLLVIGATYPEELGRIREMCPELTFLVPGVGAQGGDVEQVVKRGSRKSDGEGLIINSSRQIIYASNGEDFAEAARKAAIELRDVINSFC